MQLNEVMDRLAPVVGLSSLIGAPESVRFGGASSERVNLGGAREALAHAEALQRDAKSDAAYWGYVGQVAYWRCVVALLEAAEITGPDDLPDIPPDFLDRNQVVMDAAWSMEQWGRAVLDAARESGRAEVADEADASGSSEVSP